MDTSPEQKNWLVVTKTIYGGIALGEGRNFQPPTNNPAISQVMKSRGAVADI
jgi:hypothetical protein